MPAPAEHLITEAEEKSLHQRLLAGDVTASADLARLFLDHLIAWLVKTNRATVPEEMCNEAAADTLVALIKSPASYDRTRGKRLAAYLRMSAQGDLRNHLKREERHRANQIQLDDVELSLPAGKYLAVDDDPLLRLQRQEETEKAVRTVVAPVRNGLTETELRVLELVLQGERKTAVIAQAMGITHLPKKNQKVEVKRLKDKLKQRIKRGTSGDGEAS